MMGRWVLSGAFLIYFLFPCSLVQEHTPTVQNTDMSEGPSFYPKFQMSSYTPRDISSQLPQEPAWNLAFQMGQSPLVTSRTPMQSSPSVREQKVHWQESQGSSIESSIQMQPGPVMNPGLPTLRRPSGHPSHQSPSRPSSRSGFHVPIGPLVESDKYGKKQTGPVAPRKPRMEKRTQYSTKQKSVLQECFAECQYPDQKLCMELASLVGVTEKEIKVWFKNNRAKCKQKNVPEALPETNGGSKAVSGSSNFPGSIAVVGYDQGEPMTTAMLDVDSTPKLNCSQESSLDGYWTYDGAMCCLQEDVLDGNAPVTAGDSGESAPVEAQADIAAARAPVAIAVATQSPQDWQDLHPCEEELWQGMLEDFHQLEDWFTKNYIESPSSTSHPLD
ncbi:oocyte-specific homeobox protein 6-like [Rattus norvegicus]|uniref:Oocyte specific homeobox 6 like n=1 Tax=Rattus norvegicus TaxID=10116 RepID=A0ABK0L0L8_RAT|nr:retinal homeobox protein Rx3-like [Rattus norvegicus]|eukprot:XP_006245631.1 PREDICTED: retinal homeobox protein Rx3-like [Rattus norvegicus]